MKLFRKRVPTPVLPLTECVLRFGNRLSFGWILLFAFLLVALIGGMLIYSRLNIDTINRQPTQSQRFNVSSKTKAQLTQLVQSSTQLKFIMISEVDVKFNTRVSRWWFLDDPAAAEIRVQESLALPLPLFNSDPKNTVQMIAIVNNEFTCAPFMDTLYATHFDGLHPPILTICQLAIPLPRQGAFSGILTFGLKMVPTKEEENQLRLEASRIAVELFLRGEIK